LLFEQSALAASWPLTTSSAPGIVGHNGGPLTADGRTISQRSVDLEFIL